jgi:hypothetical protein
MPAPSTTQFPRAVLLAIVPITFLFSSGISLTAGEDPGPKLEITSPQRGFTTSAGFVDVTVSFKARLHDIDTILLMVDGVEADRLTWSSPSADVTHTFTLDTSSFPDGIVRLKARALRTKKIEPQKKGQPPRTKSILVANSETVRLRIDHDISDGVIVGPAGGELISADDVLTLAIPEGALASPRQIFVRPLDPANESPFADGATIESAFELLPHGLQFAEPLSVSVKSPTPAEARGDGFVIRLASLRSVSDGIEETLAGQIHETNGNTGARQSSGTLTHFSRLYRVLYGHTEFEITGVPEVVGVDTEFTAAVTVTDTERSQFDGRVFYDDTKRDNLERRAPLTGEIEVGQLTAGFINRLPVLNVRYVCDEEGIAVFAAGLFFTDTNEIEWHYKTLFCRSETAGFDHTRGSSTGRAPEPEDFRASIRVDPPTRQQRVGAQVTVTLVVEAFHDIGGISSGASVTDLRADDDILSPPTGPRGTKDRGQAGHSIPVVFTGLRAETPLEYSCLKEGTTHLAFSVIRSFREGRITSIARVDLLVAITCTGDGAPPPPPIPNQPPRITSPAPSPDPSPIPPNGAPRSFVPVAVDPEGRPTVWDLLKQGADGSWTSELPQGFEFNPENGEFTITSDALPGEYRFRLGVSDDLGARDVQEFTLALVAAPPVPGQTTVPLVLNLTRTEAQPVAAAAGLGLRTVGTVVDAARVTETIISQSPAAGALTNVGGLIDVVITIQTPEDGDVASKEAINAVTTFNLPPGNRVTIGGTNGFQIVDAITRQVPSAGLDRLSFTNQGLGPFFGALVLTDPQGTGGDTLFAYGSGTAQSMFDPVANRVGLWQVSTQRPIITDASYFGGNPANPGALFVNFTTREIYPLVPVDLGAFRIFTWNRPLAERFAFESAPSGPVTAFAWDLEFLSNAGLSPTSPGRVLVATDGSPGRLYLVNPAGPSLPATDLGTAGNSPRQLRCAPSVQLCVVSNLDSDSLTIVRWDGRTTASIAGTVAVGDGPVGIGIAADGTNARVISTGFNDDTYTVTTLAGDGSVTANVTHTAPAGCVNPGHAIWLPNTPGTAVMTCRGSSNFFVVTP